MVETERLRLRGHGLGDFANSCALWGDAEVTRYAGGRPLTEEEVWARLMRYAGHWTLQGYGYWVVEEKATGEFVGEVGIADHRREMLPRMGGVAEVGWVLARSKHGLGYATESVKAVVAWGLERFAPEEIRCMIDPENAASLTVAKKCGFVELFRSDYKGTAVVVLSLATSRE